MNQQQLEEVGAALRQTPREAGLSGNLWDGKTLAVWIEQQYGITVGVRQCQRLFRQLGFRLRQPRPQIALADAARQKTQKKLQALMADPSIDLWASDEVHFQQHGLRCRMWVPPETKDPILLHHPTRRSVGYFGAVRLRDGRFWSCRETGKFNAETFWEFMKQLQQSEPCPRAPRGGHRRQRPLPPCPAPQIVVRGTRTRL